MGLMKRFLTLILAAALLCAYASAETVAPEE